MGKKLEKHIVVVNGANIAVMLPNNYEAIAAIVGVTKAAAGTKSDATADIKNMLRDGQILRMRVSYKNAAGKPATSDILCDRDKAADAIDDLVGKTYNGQTILNAYFPARKRYR